MNLRLLMPLDLLLVSVCCDIEFKEGEPYKPKSKTKLLRIFVQNETPIFSDTFSQLDDVEHLVLTSSTFSKIYDNALCPKNVESLSLIKNHFSSSLEKEMFGNCSTLKNLTITFTHDDLVLNTSFISPETLSTLLNLKSLSLDEVFFGEGMTRKHFENFEKLEVLTLKHFYTQIDAKVPPDVFVDLINLKELVLVNFYTLKSNFGNYENRLDWWGLKNLKKLEVRKIDIQRLRKELFEDLPDLESLTISNAFLEILDENCFEHVTKLRELNLDQNQFKNANSSIAGLRNLERLLIGRRPSADGTFEWDDLRHMKNLKFLDMQGMKLAEIDVNKVAEYCPNLLWLDVNSNPVCCHDAGMRCLELWTRYNGSVEVKYGDCTNHV